MKKFLLPAVMLLTATTIITSCNKKEGNPEEKAEAPAKTADSTKAGLKIAFVDIDSVQEHYNLCKDINDKLEAKSLAAQKELQGKQSSLEQHAKAMQDKYEAGRFTSQEELENAQATLQKEQQEAATREQQLTEEIQKEQADALKQVTDSVESFIKSYNKTKKYDYILMKSTTLYANPAYDITDEVTKGLNKRYKKESK